MSAPKSGGRYDDMPSDGCEIRIRNSGFCRLIVSAMTQTAPLALRVILVDVDHRRWPGQRGNGRCNVVRTDWIIRRFVGLILHDARGIRIGRVELAAIW